MRQILFLFFSLLLAFACNSCKDDDLIQDTSKIKAFQEHFYSSKKKHLNKHVDLYIDYSTCLSKIETDKSDFYKAIQPKLCDCKPSSFWSIKGKNITKELGDPYTHLNSISEVNYAELKQAVEKIVKDSNQAILITDGEYFQENGNRSNYNNPYLSTSFEKWLLAGHDIYIYSEEYSEKNRFPKKRYYFLFTDRDIEDNIYNILSKGITLGNVKLTKLSSTDFKVTKKYDGVSQPKVNDNLAINPSSYFAGKNFEFQEYQIDWSDIVKYIQDAHDPNTDAPLPGGDFILRGIFVDTKSLVYFTIEDIDVKVYNAFDAFRNFEDTSHLPKIDSLSEIKELFTIDKDAFKKNGEVVLKIDKNFIGNGLNHKNDSPRKENLLKVDIVISKAKDNFRENTKHFDIFKFTSIDAQTSVLTN